MSQDVADDLYRTKPFQAWCARFGRFREYAATQPDPARFTFRGLVFVAKRDGDFLERYEITDGDYTFDLMSGDYLIWPEGERPFTACKGVFWRFLDLHFED
jgi:hypothetical protein